MPRVRRLSRGISHPTYIYHVFLLYLFQQISYEHREFVCLIGSAVASNLELALQEIDLLKAY